MQRLGRFYANTLLGRGMCECACVCVFVSVCMGVCKPVVEHVCGCVCVCVYARAQVLKDVREGKMSGLVTDIF